MSIVSSVVEIILWITRDVCSIKNYQKTFPHLHFKQYTPPAQIKHTLHTQPGITYAQKTKQDSYAPTNIE
jgi:hypothetical protein